MINFFKKLSTRAQNISEYTLLLTIIMGSIIIMGPYVIRSLDANLKGWDDSVQDSHREILTQAPSNVVTIPGCDCDGWTDVDCGPASSPGPLIISCPVYFQLQSRHCTPVDLCESFGVETYRCIFDSICCQPWADVIPLTCGVNAFPNGTSCPGNVCACVGDVCCDGSKLQSHLCDGGNLTKYQCIPDLACDFSCQPPGALPSSTDIGFWCSDSSGVRDDMGLSNNTTSFSFVDTGGCTDPTKCEIECNSANGWIAGPAGCVCPPGAIPLGTRCVCAPGFVLDNTCGANECEQGICPVGFCVSL